MPPSDINKISQVRLYGKTKRVIQVEKKKMGRPTDNPRTEKIGFRMSPTEIEDIQKCAEALSTQRVNAVVEGIRLLKQQLKIK